jgi:hypothetical protein
VVKTHMMLSYSSNPFYVIGDPGKNKLLCITGEYILLLISRWKMRTLSTAREVDYKVLMYSEVCKDKVLSCRVLL